jgi:hypothetical protein
MEQQAAVIFAGQVIAVRRVPGTGGATGVVEIDFAIDDAVRGCSAGAYTLREWAGLWPAGEQAFRAGQRFLMLLHAPSAAGLSSPVGGMDGAIPIRGGAASALLVAARVAIASAASASAANADTRVVDMRWVATRVVRPVQYGAASPVHNTVITSPVRAEMMMPATMPLQAVVSEAPAVSSAGLQAPAGDTAGADQDVGYGAVLALLRSWGESDAAAR